MLLSLSGLFLAFGLASGESRLALLFFVAAQTCILAKFIWEGHVTSVGAFLFMSFLFFAIRPLYIELEGDISLIVALFRADSSDLALRSAMAWATGGSWALALGAVMQRHVGNWSIRDILPGGRLNKARESSVIVSSRVAGSALFLQCVTLVVMGFISSVGRGIYESSAGAYAWDFPMVLQGVQVFGLSVAVERWRQEKSQRSRNLFFFSLLLLVITSWFAREVTLFRGAYITPILIAGFIVMLRFFGRVSYVWLIVPIVGLMPVFRALGETRNVQNQELRAYVGDKLTALAPHSYWQFFDSDGDMNIFDTFVAAIQHDPSIKPYVYSWIYPPAHIIPRAVWPGKPEKGVLQDMTYTNGAPYSPGLAGFFVGDGGKIWMIGNMFFLGFVLSWTDMKTLRLRPGYFKMCLYAILTVNALYLTRFYLWQHFWQVIYFSAPCWFLARYVLKENFRFRSVSRHVQNKKSPRRFAVFR